jgi:hypothetical protein
VDLTIAANFYVAGDEQENTFGFLLNLNLSIFLLPGSKKKNSTNQFPLAISLALVLPLG